MSFLQRASSEGWNDARDWAPPTFVFPPDGTWLSALPIVTCSRTESFFFTMETTTKTPTWTVPLLSKFHYTEEHVSIRRSTLFSLFFPSSRSRRISCSRNGLLRFLSLFVFVRPQYSFVHFRQRHAFFFQSLFHAFLIHWKWELRGKMGKGTW